MKKDAPKIGDVVNVTNVGIVKITSTPKGKKPKGDLYVDGKKIGVVTIQ